jgi:catechol 2,3-dioxygenase-like lactoylglutathione lyase family enzyme
MQVLELNHVALFVAEVERSTRFYRDRLGFAQIPRPAFDFPGAWLRLGTRQELHLIGGRLKGPVDDSSRGGHLALQVPDIRAAAAELRAQGLGFRGPGPRPDGAMQIFLEDPDGHLVEFCQLPPA